MGCAVVRDASCHTNSVVSDVKNFRQEFRYYEFGIERPRNHPEPHNRSVIVSFWRDIKAMHHDIDHFILDADCQDYDSIPNIDP